MYLEKRGQYYRAEFAHPVTGKRMHYSTKVRDKEQATRKAWEYHKQLSLSEVGLEERPKPETVTVTQLLNYLQSNYEARGKWDRTNTSLFKATRENFGNRVAGSITAKDIEEYIKQMKQDEYSESTIAHRLQVLAQAHEHARETGVSTIPAPPIPELPNKDVNHRDGFFSRDEIEAVIELLPEHLKDFVRLGFFIGWRRGALSGLKWTDVDFTQGEERLKLRGVLSKNGKPYSVPLTKELLALIKRQQAKRKFTNGSGATVLSSYVFHTGDGSKIGDFRWVWNEACSRVGLGTMVCAKCGEESSEKIWCAACHQRRKYEGRLFHDLRRSAAKWLIKKGCDRKTAKNITGHKTDSMFERYQIVVDDDKREALEKVTEEWTPKVMPITGHSTDAMKERHG